MTEALARRLEESEVAHWASLMEGLRALPGNPYAPQVQRFGSVVALACPGMPKRVFVNRVFGGSDQSLPDLDEAVAWMSGLGLPRVRVDVAPVLQHDWLLKHLAEQGFTCRGFQMALYGPPARLETPLGVEVRLATTPEEFAFAAEALPAAFGETDDTWRTWLLDSMRATFTRPDWRTYIACVDGKMAGFGQLHMAAGVGSLALAGTLDRFRGRGVQSALILRRMADAAAAGCDLVATQTGNGTASQRNMERLGLRIAYTKAEFYRSSAYQSAAQQT